MKTKIIRANNFPETLSRRWAEIQEGNPTLYSPFFRPEFTQAVARARNDVFVAVVNDGEAFFPFQRGHFGLGKPVGGPVSDYHGLVAELGYQCNIKALMKACRLRNWDFDHVPAAQTMFAPWHAYRTGSPVIDIADGPPIGFPKLQANHSRKRRKLEREVGPIEVELVTYDPSMLDLCLQWKSAQYLRTGLFDLFTKPWIRTLAEDIASQRNPDFAGMVSVMRAGGKPVAAHFGLRTNTVWHYWFPVYDYQFHQYSTGMLLLLEMVAGASPLGIKTIDFGRGYTDYKMRLATRVVSLIEGRVLADQSLMRLLQGRAMMEKWLVKAPVARWLATPASAMMQSIRRQFHFG
jgi:CelD/BcsL family acetyltransferase involved in cellulose biosynthesis